MSEPSPLSDRLAGCATSPVCDVIRALGREPRILPRSLRPLLPGRTLAGSVFTARGARHNTSADEALLSWTRLLSDVPPNAVLTIETQDDSLAHMGELSAEALLHKGARGAVIDGGCRDLRSISLLGFQVWFRYATPADIVGRWLPEETGCEIGIGGVRIAPDDLLLGDDDGLVALSAAEAPEVIALTEEIMATESAVRSAIRAGVDPHEAYLRHRKF